MKQKHWLWPMLAAGWVMSMPSAQAADPKELAATVCIACHGPDGNSLAPVFPKIAGQQPVYLEKQLNEFLSGKRKNAVMEPFFGSFGKGDIPGLAAFYAAQKPTPGTVEDAKLAATGKKLFIEGNPDSGVPACMGCHLEKGEGNERYPRLAGQHQAYTIQQIADFKAGTRANDKAKIMRSVAERMTEDEMKAVAEYIAGLQ